MQEIEAVMIFEVFVIDVLLCSEMARPQIEGA